MGLNDFLPCQEHAVDCVRRGDFDCTVCFVREPESDGRAVLWHVCDQLPANAVAPVLAFEGWRPRTVPVMCSDSVIGSACSICTVPV